MKQLLEILDSTQKEKLDKIKDASVAQFINEAVELCQPKCVFINTGSKEDLDYIRKKSVELGEEKKLATDGHTMHYDNIRDQARDKKNTCILVPEGTELQVNTFERNKGLEEVKGFLKGTMAGKEMIVAFHALGPEASEFALAAIQVTDSYYVAHSEAILYRPGYDQFVSADKLPYFFTFIHSAGALDENNTCKDIDNRRIYIDIEGDRVYSVNAQYGGNTLGLKKLAMRLAIKHASKDGWLCEHMLIAGIRGPKDRVTYFTGAFPSLCGKTSTAMMEGELIVGDDIAYIREINGEARGVNVEKGIFGIIQGVNSKDDPLIWQALHSPHELIFSNCLMTPEGKVHWIKKDGDLPAKGVNFQGEWTPDKKDADGKAIPPSHPNARFTIALDLLDNLDPEWDRKDGMPISAFVYGGRDSDTSVPVEQAFDWEHGIVTKGAALESETTAATLGAAGVRVINPMSNIDFLSVPLGKYLEMNLEFGKKLKTPPSIFGVNYFITEDGEFLNTRDDKRVWYKWIELRVHNEVDVIETPTGLIPHYEDLARLFKEVLNKDYTKADYDKQFKLRVPQLLAKIDRIEAHYKTIDGIPKALFEVLEAQRQRLTAI